MTPPTIGQLGGDRWSPRDDPSARHDPEVAELLRLPMDELTPGNLRLLLQRRAALATVVPMALALVRVAPHYDAGTGRGDLRAALELLGDAYWASDPAGAAVLRAAGRPADAHGRPAA